MALNEKQKSFLDLVIYQIYPRSFKDSNGDGIGDIRGIISKLDYLKELGVNAIWLCPCYKSPNYDNGYDVADYRDIMDEFGTFDDIKELIRQMHDREMKLIMDLVPNHTSYQHKWFEESRKSRDNEYSDYYYWFDRPVNDWRASFGGSVWEYEPARDQYYLHSYAIQQPDLNWDNPQVVKEMQDVVDFWVDLGVAGFRIDVIDQISKDFDGVGYPGGRNCFGPNLHKYINLLFGREKVKDIFTVGECWANTVEEIKKHIGADRGELSTLFQFDHLDCGRDDKWTRNRQGLSKLRDVVSKWQKLTQENDLVYSLFTDNHDNSPFVSRAGDDLKNRYMSATCIAAMVYLQKGVPFIYQGQEFGTVAPRYDSIDDFDDIESINAYKEFLEQGLTEQQAVEKLNFGSRDNSRRPIAWDNSQNFGFSDTEPWIGLHSRGAEINLEKDRQCKDSVFEFYKQLLKLRRETPAIRYGDCVELSKNTDPYCVFCRELDGKRITVVCNFEQESHIDVSKFGTSVALSNNRRSRANDGVFAPYEVAVFEK